MEEQAFKGSVLEGRERRYTVINEKDVAKYLSKRVQKGLIESLNFPLSEIQMGRMADGKKPFNSYIVINTDEPYIDEIIAVMKRHGHWEGEISNEDIGTTKKELFISWREELGYNKAMLLACNYPVKQVVEMTEEDAEAEVEALTN